MKSQIGFIGDTLRIVGPEVFEVLAQSRRTGLHQSLDHSKKLQVVQVTAPSFIARLWDSSLGPGSVKLIVTLNSTICRIGDALCFFRLPDPWRHGIVAVH